MKGFVFTEFLEMVEDKFGFEVADQIVTEEDLPSGGVYTSIGTYDHKEMVILVTNLSKASGIPVPDLLNVYGKYLFGIFQKGYAQFFEDVDSSFDFLSRVDSYIHLEVKKLYPKAELPRFKVERVNGSMSMLYESSRKMSDLALGLISGCMEHYGEEGTVTREMLSEDGSRVLIRIEKKHSS